MDELKKLGCSRRGHKSHLSKILNNVDEILQKLSYTKESEPDLTLTSSEAVLLAEHQKQLRRKAEIFNELDLRIIENTDDEEKLEAAVFDSADLQTMLSEKIALISHTLEVDSPREQTVTESAEVDAHTPQLQLTIHSRNSPTQTQVQEDTPTLQESQSNHTNTNTPSDSNQPSDLTTTQNLPHRVDDRSSSFRGHAEGKQFATRLPKLEIPVFTGEPLDWQPFWDCFEAAIHANPSLSAVQKLSYLRAQLQGEAARTIAGLPLTNMNYGHSINLLKDRYGQPQRIINAHVQALLDLPRPVNKLTSLQLFHDTIASHVRCLQSLGKSPKALETLLVPMILTKLPEETKKNMARDHATTAWTIEELQAAIMKELRVFEVGQQTSTLTNQLAVPTAAFYTSANKKTGHRDANSKPICAYCKGTHSTINCDVHKDVSSRIEVIKKRHLCFNCLAHHRVSQCTSKNRCRTCSGKHHTSICNELSKAPGNTEHSTNKKNIDQTNKSSNPPANTNTDTVTLTTFTSCHATCLLKTAVGIVVGAGSQTDANILFDEGSQRSFLTEKLANELALQPHKFENISLSSFGADRPLHKRMDAVMIHIKTMTGELVPLSALVVPTIAAPVTNPLTTDVFSLPHLKGLQLAHPVTMAENFEISLLVGADFYWDLVGDHIIRGDGPTAMSSKLGYLLSGPVLLPRPPSAAVNILHVAAEHEQEEQNLLRFWQVEDTAITPAEQKSQDHKFLKTYCESHITRQDDGTYCASLPWKPEHPPLPDNFSVCQKRTRSLAFRLAQSAGLLQTYDNILKEQLNRDFIEPVPNPKNSDTAHYIPHHPVKKNSDTTPVRIVYDCSCRQSSGHPSLNDCLLTGPPFLVDLCAIILRFRKHQYGLSTDIEKAFLHITLAEKDRNFTRFLWLSDPLDPSSEFVVYRFKRILFGAVSSPFILYAILHYHLQQYNTPLSCNIQANLYVDNIISGCITEQQAIQYFGEARSIMSCAGFNLRAWASNCESLNRMAQDNKIASSSRLTNVLGLQWNTTTDQLFIAPKKIHMADKQLTTKRQVLKDASKLFDPLGIASPVSVCAKLFMQKLWQLHINWDEPLSVNNTEEWSAIISDIQHLSKLTIERQFFKTGFPSIDVKLHVFADASTRAYGAVAYLTNNNDVSFVMAKNRVAPLKNLTLPKLELMAAVVASRVARFVIDALHLQGTHTYFWGDSQITLHWLNSKKVLPQFISRRVHEIKDAVPGATWSYCPTEDNPADLLTRGVNFKYLSSPNNLWWKGPAWITSPGNWPKWQPQINVHMLAAAAIAQEFVPQPTTKEDSGLHHIIQVTDYSSLNRLLAVTAYVHRFINNLCRSQPRQSGPLTAKELGSAKMRWVKNCQEQSYPREIASIKSKPGQTGTTKPSLVRQLRLFVDDAGLLRCGGRIHNAPLSETAKFPYLLPQDKHLTLLIVYHVHVFLSHAGVGSTLTALRQSLWIPSGRQYVKKLLRRCTICRKHGGRPYATPESAPLPKVRVQDVSPFTITGVDFTGALYVKQYNGEESKVYICLFTCATSRAIHLEVVTDLSAPTFLLAFRRFAARRSLPQVIMSDNATTYTSAAEELAELLSSEEIKTVLGRKGIEWKFIPKKAPWFGGYWERLIGLTKASIKKTLGRAHIALPTLQTIITEVEAVLNDRPLTYVSDDITDPEPLTPAHLLHGRRITKLPHQSTILEDLQDPDYGNAESVRRDAKVQSILLQHFVSRWKHEYLTSLREFYRPSRTGGQQVHVGDVVLVHDDCPRTNWRMAVVENLIKGNDGLVRSVSIRTKNGVTNRPVSKLYPLELSEDVNTASQGTEGREDDANTNSLDVSSKNDRPHRNAAERARQRLSEWTEIIRAPPEDVGDYY